MFARLNELVPPLLRPIPIGTAEDEASFTTYSAELLRQVATLGVLTLLAATLLWWPVDFLVFSTPGQVEAFAKLRVQTALISVLSLVIYAGLKPRGRWSLALAPPLYAAMMGGIAYHLGSLGELGWLADANLGLIPFALAPLRLGARTVSTLGIAGTMLGCYFLPFPENRQDPQALGQLSFTLFAALYGIVTGEIFYRILRRVFFQQRQTQIANQRLAELRDSLVVTVAERTKALRDLALHLDNAQEAERRRIARDLHDHLGQELTAMRYTVARLEDRIARRPQEAGELVQDLGALVNGATKTVRGFLSTLRPQILDDLGLVAAAEWLCEQTERSSGLPARLEVAGREELARLDAESRLVLFRVLQEGVTNALKHAAPRALRLLLRAEAEQVYGEVADDGRGFDSALPRSGFGLFGLEERVRAGGGRMEVRAVPGQGTRLQVWLPLPRSEE
ncbi:MAG TPA: sensor histidine kinase [Myxococcota bacterium]|nr:sensor histidine kinase [Myxococcota bacterium]